MGTGYVCKCKECGMKNKLFLGVGMIYPEVCRKTKKMASLGKLGPELRNAVWKHQRGAFDCEVVVYQCTCGAWEENAKNDYYLPKKDGEPFGPYFTGNSTVPEERVVKGKHPCPKCGKNMTRIIKEDSLTDSGLTCPVCGGELDWNFPSMMWD